MARSDSYRPDSVKIFQPFWLCWRLLGVLAWEEKYFITVLYDICMNLFVYIWYPVHLTVGLLLLPMHHDIYKNMSMTITCIVCTMKHYCIRLKLKQFHEMMKIFADLDERIQSEEESKYFATNSMRMAKLLATLYLSVYMFANLAALIAVLWDTEQRLMYPAWFPFDWHSSPALYYLSILYQSVGITILIVLNFTNDAIAPVTLCLFSGQVHVFAMRVSKLGYAKRLSFDQQENELKLCIEDHNKLIKLYNTVEDSLSYMQFILFFSSGLNICVVLVYLFFFVDNLLSYIYYTIFLIAIAVELFPIYYFGSLLQEEFNDLPYAIFCSKWSSQTCSYRKSVVIFSEVALRKITVKAGGIVDINLDSFFAICKMTYSLFAVAIRIK